VAAIESSFKIISINRGPQKLPCLELAQATDHLFSSFFRLQTFNRLAPNDPYMGRTAPLTSKRCILYIYSTNIGTEYFKHALYSPFFLSSKCSLFHNANLFGSCIIHISYTGCAKIKKNNSGVKGLMLSRPEHLLPFSLLYSGHTL
jgi:hypothetical protein